MSENVNPIGPSDWRPKRSALVFILVSGLLFLVGQSPVLACSRIQPPTIEELAGRSQQMDIDPDAVVGVYQQETLARTPNMGLRQPAAATVVSRYWGVPPENTGVEMSGGEFFFGTLWFTDCGPDPQPPTGKSGYGWTDINGGTRFVWVDIGDGLMVGELAPDQVEALDHSFGAHTTLEITISDRMQATALVWWPNFLGIILVVGVLYWFIRRLGMRRARSAEAPSPNDA